MQMENDVEEDNVLDFSSGSLKVVKISAEKVKIVSANETSNGLPKAFTIFRDLIDVVNVTQELEAAGNVTVFTPLNTAFEKLTTKIEDVSVETLRKWILKHFVQGFLYRKEMRNGPYKTLGGEYVTIIKDEMNKVKVYSSSGASRVKAANIKLEFGLVHVIDTVIT